MEEKSYHHGDLRTAMIEKGIELINEEGLKALSLRKAAAACGVSHAAPYSHFAGKDELLSAIRDHITEQFVSVLGAAVEKFGHSPEGLMNMGIAYVLFFARNPKYFSFTFLRTNIHIDLTENQSDSYKPFEIYKGLMLTLLDESAFPKELQMDTIIANWAFVHGLAAVATMPGAGPAEEWERKLPGLLCSMRITRPEERPEIN